MLDIIIYTKKETVECKRNRKNIIAYWTLHRMPKEFEHGKSKVYFAYDKHIQGYFDSDTFSGYSGKPIPDNAIKFDNQSWTPLKKKIPCNSFQGFKYADKIPELD